MRKGKKGINRKRFKELPKTVQDIVAVAGLIKELGGDPVAAIKQAIRDIQPGRLAVKTTVAAGPGSEDPSVGAKYSIEFTSPIEATDLPTLFHDDLYDKGCAGDFWNDHLAELFGPEPAGHVGEAFMQTMRSGISYGILCALDALGICYDSVAFQQQHAKRAVPAGISEKAKEAAAATVASLPPADQQLLARFDEMLAKMGPARKLAIVKKFDNLTGWTMDADPGKGVTL